MSQAIPAFADKKKCEDNDNNNCNDSHKTQKIDQKNKCEIENENSHHSKNNDNENLLICDNIAANVKDLTVVQVPPIPEGCPPDTLYAVQLQEGLSKVLQADTVLCLNKRLGAQDAFALVDGGEQVAVVVSQPNGGCSPPFVEADVIGGIGPNGATSVCVKLG